MSLVTAPESGLSIRALKVEQKGEQVTLTLTLKNSSRQPIMVWDPLNYESRAAIRVLIVEERGKETDITPPPAPRGTGVATGTKMNPGAVLTLPPVTVTLVRPTGAKGKLSLVVLYRNAIRERDAVKGVWTGTLRSKPQPMFAWDRP